MKLRWRKNIKRSPFYSSILSKGLRIPVIDKKFFMTKFDSINTRGVKKEKAFEIALQAEKSRDFESTINGVSVGLSSGTSGNRGLFLTSRKEQEKWVGAVLDRVIGFSLRKRKVAFFLRANNNLYEAVGSKLLTFDFYDLQKPIAELIEQFTKSNSNLLVAQPSVLLEIARYCEREHKTLHLEKIISVAEVLEDDTKAYISDVFQLPVHQVYQCTEGFLAYTCEQGNLHLNEDFLEIKRNYLDKEETKFHPIITDYLRYTQPVINYELNDILHVGDLCACGSRATVISKIEGRSDDIFVFETKVEKVIIFPDFIRRAVIESDETISNYIVAQKDNTTISISIEGEDKEQQRRCKQAIAELLCERGVEDFTINFTPFEHNSILKFKRIRNDSNTKF